MISSSRSEVDDLAAAFVLKRDAIFRSVCPTAPSPSMSKLSCGLLLRRCESISSATVLCFGSVVSRVITHAGYLVGACSSLRLPPLPLPLRLQLLRLPRRASLSARVRERAYERPVSSGSGLGAPGDVVGDAAGDARRLPDRAVDLAVQLLLRSVAPAVGFVFWPCVLAAKAAVSWLRLYLTDAGSRAQSEGVARSAAPPWTSRFSP